MEDVIDKTVVDFVQEGAEIRSELNDVHWKRMGKIKKAISLLISDTIPAVSAINDAVHYRNGGYPSPNSPPRHEVVCDKIAAMFKYLSVIDQEHLVTNYLKSKHGLEIKDISDFRFEFDKEAIPQVIPILDEIGIELDFSDPDKKNLRILVEEMDDQQSTICGMSNSIKRDLFGQVKAACGKKITKKIFLNNVGLKVKDFKSHEKAVRGKEKLLEEQTTMENVLEKVIK